MNSYAIHILFLEHSDVYICIKALLPSRHLQTIAPSCVLWIFILLSYERFMFWNSWWKKITDRLHKGMNVYKMIWYFTADLLREGAPEGQTDEVSKIVLICKFPKIHVRSISPTTIWNCSTKHSNACTANE